MEVLDSNVLLRTPSPTCRWEKQCTANMVVRFHPAPLWFVSVSDYHTTVMWSNTLKEQKCLSKIVVRADDEFE